MPVFFVDLGSRSPFLVLDGAPFGVVAGRLALLLFGRFTLLVVTGSNCADVLTCQI